MSLQRIVALLIMLIPGVVAIYGWTLMREAFFTTFDPNGFHWWTFLLGLLLFLLGLAFIGGFIRHRDKKRNYRPRFTDDLDEEK